LQLGLQYKLEQYDIGRQRHWMADNALSLASQKQLMSGSNVIGRPTPWWVLQANSLLCQAAAPSLGGKQIVDSCNSKKMIPFWTF